MLICNGPNHGRVELRDLVLVVVVGEGQAEVAGAELGAHRCRSGRGRSSSVSRELVKYCTLPPSPTLASSGRATMSAAVTMKVCEM